MTRYDPDIAPDPKRWLAADESERIAAVEAFHRRQRIELPSLEMHAMLHTIIENQIALEEAVVIETMARLRAEGLTRHDAVHAMAQVMAEHMFDLMKAPRGKHVDGRTPYFESLKRLTARQWLASADDE